MALSRTVRSSDGTALHVSMTGPAEPALSILFVHGLSQSHLTWQRQLDSGLGPDVRMAALDLRGHGRSEKPATGYRESRVWADDLSHVVAELGPAPVVICAWSYGGLVLLDYLRFHGERALAGVILIAAANRMGAGVDDFGADAAPLGFTSVDAEESIRSLRQFVRCCRARELLPIEEATVLGYTVLTPPRVRRAMLDRIVDNDDQLRALGVPALIVHGEADQIVLPRSSARLATLLSHAVIRSYPDAGHSPFDERPEMFDADLASFVLPLVRPAAG
jgi:non-heme chloroperoxidase